MSLRTAIKKNKLFSIVSAFFSIWIIFLIILSVINKREVIFYDALAQNDVSSDYTSSFPLERYFVEPFIGLAYIFGMEFLWLIAFFILYLVFRIIYLYFKRIGIIKSEKYKTLMYPIDDWIRFAFKLFSIVVLLIGTIILIGYLILGFYFVSRYFMVFVQLGIRIAFIILLIKTSYIIIKLLHPNFKLNYESNKRKKLPKKDGKVSNSLRVGKRELIYMLGTAYLFLAANILLISTPFPTHRIETDLATDEFLFDFHCHTTMSDGWLTVEQRVMYYIEHGISGAAFSDHDNIRGAKAAQKFVEERGFDFVVFMAAEWTDNEHDIHLNYFGLEETIVPPMSDNPFTIVMNASDMIKYVKSKGGYVIVNHYNARPNKNGGLGVPYNFTDLMNWGVDGFEIVNGDSVQDREIREFCLDNSLICFGGSDVHTNEDLNCFVKLRLDNPTNMSIANIFQNLARNDHEVIAIKLHSNVVNFPDDINDLGFEIFEDYLNYLLNLNSIQVLSWIFWSCLVYILFFLSYRKVKKSNLSRLRDKIT